MNLLGGSTNFSFRPIAVKHMVPTGTSVLTKVATMVVMVAVTAAMAGTTMRAATAAPTWASLLLVLSHGDNHFSVSV